MDTGREEALDQQHHYGQRFCCSPAPKKILPQDTVGVNTPLAHSGAVPRASLVGVCWGIRRSRRALCGLFWFVCLGFSFTLFSLLFSLRFCST